MKRGSHTGCRPALGCCQGPRRDQLQLLHSPRGGVVRWRGQSRDSQQDALLTDRSFSPRSLGSPLQRDDTWNWGAHPGHTMVLQPSERHHRDWSHRRLGPWCSPTGSPAPLSCETGCGEGSWILVCRLLVPTQVSLLSMEEDIDTRKINNSFLRDHSYATEADIISTVEFNHTGELLATGDKGGRVVIFQREQESKNQVHRRGEYNVYSTFQSHEPEFDYLKSLEIEEKINKIRWLPQQNAAYFLLSTNDKTVKLWKVSERDKRPEGYNLKDEEGRLRDPATITTLRVPVLRPMDLMVEATPRRVFANAHTYHINSISVNSDYETYMSADDLRINLWNFEITNQSFNIVDIKPANMEELTEVITAAEFHPHHCNSFVYSSSKGTIRLCDMRASALCDRHSKFFEEPEDPSNRSFFSEIISSISDVKFSHSGRYIMTRDYLTVKVWDLNMENRPIETYQVHDYLRSKLCSLYENDCIFDKFECVWNGSDSVIMTGSYNNFFRMFDRNTKRDVTLEASRENSKPRAILKPRKVCVGGKRRKDEISVDSLDFSKKILHTAWHPSENIIAVAATNNLYIFQDKVN
ncbi:serine/threonine-protein phosphatase 2A 55 kDa regulatory subunit B beta isoform isoform X1 [Phoca vitulina]|nr:serine/threonine-protein phosphatase 2A 55 kDa regulatory subunit B beta isoform isoform X1 [Phoca vitulina]